VRFSTRAAPNPPCSPKSLPVAFARSNMFKSAVVSDCLMMTGKFAGLGVHGGHVPRDQRPPTWSRSRQRLSGLEGGEGGFPWFSR
jgi:hypothetical protein